MKSLLLILLVVLCSTLFCSAIDNLLTFSKLHKPIDFMLAVLFVSMSIAVYKIEKYLED